MLRFFRQIRQKLTENGNIRKYFWYALGEILLVMIGILLALQVNNWNEARKSEDAFKLILKDVQEDLYNDITELSLALDWHIEQDSISTRIIENRYSEEDFENPENAILYSTGLTYYDIIISDRSFQLLSDFKDQIPLKYRNIIRRLNSLYVEDQSYLNRVQQNVIDFTIDYKDMLYSTHEWTNSQEWPNEEWIDFFMNNSLHKRKLRLYRDEVRRIIQYGKRIKDKAIANYMIIRWITKDDSEVPGNIRDYLKYNGGYSLDYSGRYSYINDQGESEVSQIVQNYGLLFWVNEDDRSLFYFSEMLLREHSPDTLEFAIAPQYTVIINRDTKGAIKAMKTAFADSLDRQYTPIKE